MTLVFNFNAFSHLMGGGRYHVFMYRINRKCGHRDAGTQLGHDEAGPPDGSEVFGCEAQSKTDGALKLLSLPDTLHILGVYDVY